ncbi:VIT1/CCC1 transporter family protein [Chitinophaga rhizophila]|uniref:VIT1/CCC1 transporter family protein n=1 Tax=Chitinophaga rhizophila TaxID=2866212 RepID=A0ABS7GGR4_9BACT|nr:VIT1/CCC1 transporter family protein [Chitinophaga rhizophila]MBW8686887.1 VIT1/CCC1 transporter family protein [Chitinophaga rhizophila]
MSKEQKAIRSSGWKTDFLIGFPEGLLLLFFTTYLSHGLPVTVQQFYTINTCIWLAVSVLVMLTAYQANRGDTQHDESTLSPEERRKLERLNISEPIIENIAAEMQKDAALWEETLRTEHVEERHFNKSTAIRSGLLTGIFFLTGGILPLIPYLRNEQFPTAASTSVLTCGIAITIFSFLKSRMTSQPAIPVILRNLAYTGAVWLGAYVMLTIFK